MSEKTELLLDLIRQERDRQRTLPGSEYDGKNTVNDWIAIAGHYLNDPAKRKSSSSYNRAPVLQSDYEDSLIKAAAVILAALEHSDILRSKGDLA